MEIGIVGLPNVGKSTLFNALTGAAAAAENFPFTTIEPNVGVVPVIDERLNILAQKNLSQKIIPSSVRFLDIAGIVKGASKGEGLGNKFLGNIRSVDAVVHVVRCFRDENVINVLGDLNPKLAAEIIETELLLADMQQAEKALERSQKMSKGGDAKLKDKCAQLEQIIAGFNNGVSIRRQKIDKELMSEFQFLTAKPLLYVANTDEENSSPDLVEELRELAKVEGAGLVVLCAKMEAEIVQLPDADRSEYYAAAGIKQPGLVTLAQEGQRLLNVVSFFTSGEKETRAWPITRGTKAPQAAGKIHTDIERGFIRAEVYKYDDLINLGSVQKIQEKGLLAIEGKEYEVKDGDVVNFRFSV